MARAQANISARYWSKFGASNVRLMNLPPAQAWRALTDRADDGDMRATVAAVMVAYECQAENNIGKRPYNELWINQQVRGLPPYWATFIRSVDMQVYRHHQALAESCKKVGGIWNFLMLAIDRFMQPKNLQMQLVEATRIKDDEDAIAQLRRLSAELGTEEARRDLGERLLHARSRTHQAEGLDMLESLADHDPYVVHLLAECLRNGCGHYVGNRQLAVGWVRRAARIGDWFPLTWTIEGFEKQSDPVNALAWTLYRQDLTFAGCEEISFQPSTMRLTPAVRDALRLQQALDDAQRRQAEAITQAIENHWLAKAESAQHCAN